MDNQLNDPCGQIDAQRSDPIGDSDGWDDRRSGEISEDLFGPDHEFTECPHDNLLTKLSPVLAIVDDELGDGIIQDCPLRPIDTEKLRWSNDSGTLRERSFQEVHQGLDRSNNMTSDTSDSKAVEATRLTPVTPDRGGGDEIGYGGGCAEEHVALGKHGSVHIIAPIS
jgi:hypothetical protein